MGIFWELKLVELEHDEIRGEFRMTLRNPKWWRSHTFCSCLRPSLHEDNPICIFIPEISSRGVDTTKGQQELQKTDNCYGWWFVSPKHICWSLISTAMVSGLAFGRWWAHEGRTLLIRMISFIKRELGIPPTMGGHSEKLSSTNQRAGSHDIESASALTTDFQHPELREINVSWS